MKLIITILLFLLCVTSFAQIPASGKLKVYKLQSNYVAGSPGSTALSGSEGIGIFDADGLLLRKVSASALGLPSGTTNRIAKFTGSSSIGNSTATDSAGFFGFGQVDGSGLQNARINITTQGATSGTNGIIIKNSSDAAIGSIKNDGGFSFGTNPLVWDNANVKLTASASWQLGTMANQPLYFITNNTIRTALDATAFTVNVPVDNTADSYTGLARGTTAQRPTATGSRVRYNSDSTWYEGADGTSYELFASRNWVRANFGAPTTLYSGDGTLAGNRVVTGNNLSLTFDDIFAFKINSDYNTYAKANGTGIYSAAVIGAGNVYEIGYTPVAGIFSKGAGVFIDTNENVGMGAQPPTTMPLYATGASTFVQGLQSNAGIFPRVDNVTVTGSLSLTQYFLVIDATTGNITLTLPAASTAFGNNMGIAYKFQRIDATGNTVTIQRAGSDTINGGTSFTLTTQWEEKEIQCVSTSTWLQH